MATTMNKAQSNTGTENRHFDLVSVLYHSLEGGAVYEQYIQDAKEAGDQDLTNFFQDVKDTNCRLADRAQELLKARLNQG
ncbi:hypothetical protein IQ241_24665 [Romeria aff. gracilis LEGE 07310]|uniref:Uncharacterized protein n=1 Tax=Vasconcelosia minhoensis LEGE 07310 TaxID=915328 RepID=A0A8J7AX41_9CYAN|nr:hypothetical protein [Romeria gracilis]MBE9080439.1 hypothetical protein [Romeria aff. gracilis LEGE 07310]